MILYNARMSEREDGIGVFYVKWHVIYETECFYMCLQDWQMTAYFQHMTGEEIKEKCKKQGRKLKRIAKRFSRFAHAEKMDALNSLLIKKKAQINHCRRNLAVVGEFVKMVEGNQEKYLLDDSLIEGTKELVSEWYVFD